MKNYNENPLVSIIIPLYNCENYIAECLYSCINQTYKNVEIIVINDGSTDASEKIVKEIAKNYKNIYLINKANGGVSSALNIGIKNMNGNYFTWLSSDDIFYNKNIELKMNEFRKNPKLKVVYSNYSLINYKSNVIKKKTISSFYASVNDPLAMFVLRKISGCSLVIKRDIFKICGKFNESMLTTQDYMMWYCIISNTSIDEWKYLNEPLIKSRLHEKQTTNLMKDIQKINDSFWKNIIITLVENREYKRLSNSVNEFASNLKPLFSHNNDENEVFSLLNELEKNKGEVIYKKSLLEKCVSREKTNSFLFEIKKNGVLRSFKKLISRFKKY